MKRDCPENSEGPKTDASEAHSVKYTSLKGSKLFLKASVNGVNLDFLIDTGATVNIISPTIWNNLNMLVLQKFDQDIVSATGTPLDVLGKAEVFLEIMRSRYASTVLIAEVEVDGILGLDFMKSFNVVTDVANNVLTINGTECSLHTTKKIGRFRVIVQEQVLLRPRTETVILGKVDGSNRLKNGGAYLVETSEKLFKNTESLVARSPVEANPSVPVGIMNLSHENQIFHAGTNIATLSSVTKVYNSS